MSHFNNITLCVKAPNAEIAVKAVNAVLGKKKDDGNHSNVVNKRPEPISGGQFIVHLLPISGAKFKEHSSLLKDGNPLSINGGEIEFSLHRGEEPEFTVDKASQFNVDKKAEFTVDNKCVNQKKKERNFSESKDPNPWTIRTTVPKFVDKRFLKTILNREICPNVSTGMSFKDFGTYQSVLIFLNKETIKNNSIMRDFLDQLFNTTNDDAVLRLNYKDNEGKDRFFKFLMGLKGKVPSFTKEDIESLLGEESSQKVVSTSGEAAAEE